MVKKQIMKPALKSALFFAALWMVLKLVFLQFKLFQDTIFVPGLLNNLFLLCAIVVGLYLQKKKEGFGYGTAFSDIKNGMVAAAPYALLVSVFMFFYYKDINPGYSKQMLEERMDIVYAAMERQTYIDSLILQNQDFNVMTKDEIYNQIKNETASAYAPSSMLTISLLGLLILGLTYAIFLTVIFRKILFRDYYN